MKRPYVIHNTIAYANVKGSVNYPNINGKVKFVKKSNGILITAEIFNLPIIDNVNQIYGFHIHEGNECTGNQEDYFKNAASHFSKVESPHPYHSGDMPPLFGNNGYAYLKFYTTRFKAYEVENKFVIIHEAVKNENTTEFGRKIGCGKIIKYKI